ncbi:MAG: alpha-D-ribose 1-methylphosphonate 5-triphosphate diphosphatase [Spirochaetales bacterium]|nr:alpha-D-ribose 1-methylphosphonate 5-triphosphate diphosphatase [Spirochaetales bacterium]
MRTGIIGGNIVLDDRIIENGSLVLEDGKIAYAGEKWVDCERLIEVHGAWVLPGFIDLHNDAIEVEAEPRPGAHIPLEIALSSLESKLISHGITSIYHSFSCIEGKREIRALDFIVRNIEALNSLKTRALIRHFVHARYDITETEFALPLENFIHQGKVDLVSFMDHTPGQGQYKNIQVLVDYLMHHHDIPEDQAFKIVEERMKKGGSPAIFDHIKSLIRAALAAGLPIASHDDDSPEKVRMMKDLGVHISEFPIDRESAKAAKREGMHVVCGAPNVLRGGSNSGNMRVIDAIRDGSVDVLCSDYLPGAMLHTVFKLFRSGEMQLPEAVRMVSLHPAHAVGIHEELGSLHEGKAGDVLIVQEDKGFPFVQQVFVEGDLVLDRRLRDFSPHTRLQEKEVYGYGR